MSLNPNAPATPAGTVPRLDPVAVLTVAALFVAFTTLTVLLLQPSELAGRVLALVIGVGLSVLALGLSVLLSGRRRVAVPEAADAGVGAPPVDAVAQRLEQAWAQRGSGMDPTTVDAMGGVRRLEPRRGADPSRFAASRPARPAAVRPPSPTAPSGGAPGSGS